MADLADKVDALMGRIGKKAIIPIVILSMFLSACGGFVQAAPGYTDTAPVAAAATFTPPVMPTQIYTATAAPTATLDAQVEADRLEFFAACAEVEPCVNWLFDYGWTYSIERDRALYGNSSIPSPAEAFANRVGACATTSFEIAYGMYMGPNHIPPAFLVFLGDGFAHEIYVFQDPESQKWGYAEISDVPIFHDATYSSIGELATQYNITNGDILNEYTLITEKDLPPDWIINGIQNSDPVTYTEAGKLP
jgi:hypothetical protein